MKSLIILIILACADIFPQLDTADYYPLNTGDYWEYYHPFYGYDIREVLGDSTMSNGKTYKKISHGEDNIFYERKSDDNIIYIYRNDTLEVKRIDLNAKEGEIWAAFPDSSFFYGIKATGSTNQNIIGVNLKYKIVDCVSIGADTSWCTEYPDVYATNLLQGIGIVGEIVSAYPRLRGARINGITYGVVSAKDESKIPEEFNLYPNYPNPFNPETVIKFSIPERVYVKGTVFSSTGERVAVLQEGEMEPGSHSLNFNGRGLSSGVYIFRLEAGGYSKTIKMMLLQ